MPTKRPRAILEDDETQLPSPSDINSAKSQERKKVRRKLVPLGRVWNISTFMGESTTLDFIEQFIKEHDPDFLNANKKKSRAELAQRCREIQLAHQSAKKSIEKDVLPHVDLLVKFY